MAEANWYYAKGRERSATVTLDQLRQLIARNDVGPNDLVWTAGMEKWTPARDVSALMPIAAPHAVASVAPGAAVVPAATAHTPSPSMPMSAPIATAIPYYTASAGMPQRAVEKLKGHARPAGDVGDWPLDDERVRQFDATAKIRKKITAAANLYRALLLLTVIGGVLVLIGALIGIGASRRGSTTNVEMIVFLVLAVFVAGFGALYYFAARATYRAQRWAPLTMFILCMLGILLNVFSMIITAMAPRSNPSTLVGGVLGMILPSLFAMVSWRAYSAIPQYRSQPAWCQELLVTANL